MQVLLMAVILAGMATMLLRTSLSRTVSARKTRRAVTAEMLIESCMAEINTLWSVKKTNTFISELLNKKVMYTDSSAKEQDSYTCSFAGGYTVIAHFDNTSDPVTITYTVEGLD